jgi:hypothetical protein
MSAKGSASINTRAASPVLLADFVSERGRAFPVMFEYSDLRPLPVTTASQTQFAALCRLRFRSIQCYWNPRGTRLFGWCREGDFIGRVFNTLHSAQVAHVCAYLTCVELCYVTSDPRAAVKTVRNGKGECGQVIFKHSVCELFGLEVATGASAFRHPAAAEHHASGCGRGSSYKPLR